MIGLAQIVAFATLADKNLKQGNTMSDDTPTLPHPYTYRTASVETMLQAVTDLTSKWPQSQSEITACQVSHPKSTLSFTHNILTSVDISLADLENGDDSDGDLYYNDQYYELPWNNFDTYEAALTSQYGEGTEIEREEDMACIEWYFDNGVKVTLWTAMWKINITLEASNTWDNMNYLERTYYPDIDLYDPQRQTPPSGYY